MTLRAIILCAALCIGACTTTSNPPRAGDGRHAAPTTAPARKVPDTGYADCRSIPADQHDRWANCMAGNAPKRLYPPASLIYSDWRT